MTTSQNGWPVVGQGAVTDRKVHGVEFPNGWLKGDVDVVFTYLIGRLHREVEPIDSRTRRPPVSPGSSWGWFVKNIEGSKSISNHASGTAIDYNAEGHPMGVRNTYGATERAKIRAILDDLDGVVRWGGDYAGRPDDMHFEIHATRAEVARVAERIRSQGKPNKPEDDGMTEADRAMQAKILEAVRQVGHNALAAVEALKALDEKVDKLQADVDAIKAAVVPAA